MQSDNDNIEGDETKSVYCIDPSKVYDGQKIACGGYVFVVITKDIVLPDGDIVRIAGVKPVRPKEQKPSIILDA